MPITNRLVLEIPLDLTTDPHADLGPLLRALLATATLSGHACHPEPAQVTIQPGTSRGSRTHEQAGSYPYEYRAVFTALLRADGLHTDGAGANAVARDLRDHMLRHPQITEAQVTIGLRHDSD
jgi:hypothetical protein